MPEQVVQAYKHIEPFLALLKRALLLIPVLLLPSCFFFKAPVSVMKDPITDTVHVYHFIVTTNKSKLADTATSNGFARESAKAYAYISREAQRHGLLLVFCEHWMQNRDSALRGNFIYKLPSKSLQILMREDYSPVVTKKKTKTQEKRIEQVYWKQALFDTIAAHMQDTTLKKKLTRGRYHSSDHRLLMVHVLNSKKSRITGFYQDGKAYIGINRSLTIAHESLHHLGAPDLYIHRYWFGKRRRIVKRELSKEIMDFALGKNTDCESYYISNYTAYTIKWDHGIEKRFYPLLKQNRMARFLFRFGLLL